MNYTTPEILIELDTLFDFYKENSGEMWKIRYNGYFLKTPKSKSVWNRRHLARSAFLNLLEHSSVILGIHTKFRHQDPAKTWYQNFPTKEEINQFVQQFEDSGLLEFVKVG